jgi:hypothetical protein
MRPNSPKAREKFALSLHPDKTRYTKFETRAPGATSLRKICAASERTMIGKDDGNAVPELPSEDAANAWKYLAIVMRG